MTTNSWLIPFAAFLIGFILCWLLVSVLGMGHRAISVLRERYKKLDASFADLENSFQSQDEASRLERRSLLDKLKDKDESIKELISDNEDLLLTTDNIKKIHAGEIEELNNTILAKEGEKVSLKTNIMQLNEGIQKLETEIEMAKSRGDVAKSSDAEMKMLQHSMLRLREMMEEEGVAYRKQIAELQQRLEEALSNKPRKDDLTLINGIGPKIESILNSHSVLSYVDLINAPEETLELVREELGGLADRIERDDWVGQAKELQEKGSA